MIRLVGDCDALVLAAPLYFDGPPASMQGLLERLLERRIGAEPSAPSVYGLAHSGLPEAANREPLLRSMKIFADALGWRWGGGIEFGATSPIDGRPLEESGLFGRRARNGLPGAAADIAAGRSFSQPTRARCRRNPFFPLPLRLMVRKVNARQREEARERGIDLFARPYADTA